MKSILEVVPDAPPTIFNFHPFENSLPPTFVIEIFIVVAQFGISSKWKWKKAGWKLRRDKLLSEPGAFFKTISSVYPSPAMHQVPFSATN